MNKSIALICLLASGLMVTPGYANYFSNPRTGVMLNIGSAPNPTPKDVREDRAPFVTEDKANTVTPSVDRTAPNKVATLETRKSAPESSTGGAFQEAAR